MYIRNSFLPSFFLAFPPELYARKDPSVFGNGGRRRLDGVSLYIFSDLRGAQAPEAHSERPRRALATSWLFFLFLVCARFKFIFTRVS